MRLAIAPAPPSPKRRAGHERGARGKGSCGIRHGEGARRGYPKPREVPSGHLYAQVMGKLDLETYNGCMASLKNAQLVEEDASHMLRWIGPKEDAREEQIIARP